MKKLLLILIISLGFITSFNANSIEGAFGYKLGQVIEDAIETDSRYLPNKEILFLEKPLPGDFRYFLFTTLKDKKVSYIQAISSSESYVSYYCNDKKGIFLKIMKIYELKYGKFVKNFFNEKDEWHSYKDSRREIRIYCKVSNSLNTIDINYFDWNLRNMRDKEYKIKKETELKEKEQQFIEEAAEYDI